MTKNKDQSPPDLSKLLTKKKTFDTKKFLKLAEKVGESYRAQQKYLRETQNDQNNRWAGFY